MSEVIEYFSQNLLFWVFSIGCYVFRETIFNHIYYTPGVGRVTNKRDRKTKTNTLVVETELGTLNLPTFFLSNAVEIDIIFFNNPVVEKNEILTRGEFKKKYSMFDSVPLQKHGRHFILPFIHTKKNKISIVISSLTEMHVYVFTIENDFIDLSKHYQDYLVFLNRLDDNLLNDVSSSADPTVNQEEPATPPESSDL